MDQIIKEACVESVEQALKAQNSGADRVELCAQWELGGLTPSKELISTVLKNISIPVRVMIRPRAGDFCYTSNELDQMLCSIDMCKDLGVEGVVFGVLHLDKTLNTAAILDLCLKAHPLKVVIHKAIDETPDPIQSLEELLALQKVDTVLTSGGKSNAFEGIDVLRNMITRSKDAIEIMAQGDITHHNLLDLHMLIGAKAYHGKNVVCTL